MGTHRVEIYFIFRPSEPLPRPDFETATTTDLANIVLYVNNKVFLVLIFAIESSLTYRSLSLAHGHTSSRNIFHFQAL